MASNARLTGTVRVGSETELTWSLDNARDVCRMLCHVRSVLSAHNVPNRVTMNVDARKVFAMVKLSDARNASAIGHTLSETFA